MKNILEVLIQAKNKLKFGTNNDFIDHLNIIGSSDKQLTLDWDDGAGEEWARFSHKDHGIVYMINAKIGVIFARKSYEKNIPKKFFLIYEIAIVNNYRNEEWFIDIELLPKLISEIDWSVSQYSVNPNCFSLNDFYYATV